MFDKRTAFVRRIATAAMLLAIGFVLPTLTMNIPQIGKMLLPMHIPVMLCGLIVGWQYGAVIGFALPILRSLVFSAPVMYPGAIAMAFELAAYAIVIGLLYNRSKWKCVRALYRALIISMLCGRIVWAVMQSVLLAATGSVFTFDAFLSGAFLTAFPGIIIQLILIPAIMIALDKTGIRKFEKDSDRKVGTR